jgi:hypothetical protein
MIRFQSLQVRLAARLTPTMWPDSYRHRSSRHQAYDTAVSLNDRELSLRADDLARAVARDGTGVAELRLPQKLASAYTSSETTSSPYATARSPTRSISAEVW